MIMLPSAPALAALRPDAPPDPLWTVVSLARVAFPGRYPLIAHAFDESEWEGLPGRKRRQKEGNPRQRFHGWAPDREPWPEEFATAAKAWVVLTEMEWANAVHSLTGLRFLWDGIAAERGGDAADFRWSQFRPEHLDAAVEQIATRPLSGGTRYQRASMIERFVGWLADNWIISIVDWHHPFPNPSREAFATRAGRTRRRDRLPTRRSIVALAKIYNEAVTPADRLLICAAGIALLTGLRAEELLRLRADCLVTERQPDGSVRYGIRFYNEKAGGTIGKYATRWLSPLAAELALELLKEVGTLTASARRMAIVLEEEANRESVPLPREYAGREWLRVNEFARLINYGRGSTAIRTGEWTPAPTGLGNLRWVVPIATVQRALQDMRLPTCIDLTDGDSVKMSELLLVVPFDFFTRKKSHTLLPMAVRYSDLVTFLAGRPDLSWTRPDGTVLSFRTPSIFERFGITEPDGRGGTRFCRMRSHMLRHWLNTVANKSGMSAYLVTVWMQRKIRSQTSHYLHSALYQETPESLAELVRENLLTGDAWGQAAVQIQALPEEDRRAFLERVIRVGHRVRGGVCVEDFTKHECTRERACTADCPRYYELLGVEEDKLHLEVQRGNINLALVQITRAEETGLKVHPRQRACYVNFSADVESALGRRHPAPTPPAAPETG